MGGTVTVVIAMPRALFNNTNNYMGVINIVVIVNCVILINNAQYVIYNNE